MARSYIRDIMEAFPDAVMQAKEVVNTSGQRACFIRLTRGPTRVDFAIAHPYWETYTAEASRNIIGIINKFQHFTVDPFYEPKEEDSGSHAV